MPRPLKPRVKVWLEAEGEYVFGFGMSRILKAVDATGSIKAAASNLGKSYRYVWGRIKGAEESLGEALVETRVGGQGASRSSLTELARDLVVRYDALRERMLEVIEAEYSSAPAEMPQGGAAKEALDNEDCLSSSQEPDQ